MSYRRALVARERALAACRGARGDLRAAVEGVGDAYQAQPLPALVGAAGVGFVLAQFQVGSGLVRAGVRIATGPAWRLVRQYVAGLS